MTTTFNGSRVKLMTGINKILRFTFLLLIIIIILEIGFYIFYQNRFSINQQSREENHENPSLSNIAITLTHSQLPTPGQNLLGKSIINSYQKGLVTSSILNNEYEGIIKELVQEHGKVWIIESNYEYDIKLTLLSKKDNISIFPFYYNKNDLSKIELVNLVNSDEKTIKFDDLKKGDNVIVKASFDLTKDVWHNNVLDYNMIKTKIIKLQKYEE